MITNTAGTTHKSGDLVPCLYCGDNKPIESFISSIHGEYCEECTTLLDKEPED